MPSPFQNWHSSRLSATVAVVFAAALTGWFVAPSVRSQAPGTMTSNVALNAMLTKLKSQQDDMAANQTKIEAQTTALTEALRQAKIYSARSGSGHR